MKLLFGIIIFSIFVIKAQAQEVTAVVGNWTVATDIDPIDDSITVMSALRSDEGGHILGVGCTAGDIGFAILWDEYVGSERASDSYRFDRMPPTSKLWDVAPNGKGTRMRGRKSEKAGLIRTILVAKRLAIRVSNYDQTTQTGVWTFDQAEEALAPTIKACNEDFRMPDE